MTTEFLSHSLNDDDFDSRAKKKTPRVCRRQRRDKKKTQKSRLSRHKDRDALPTTGSRRALLNLEARPLAEDAQIHDACVF